MKQIEITGGEVLLLSLLKQGVTTLFGYPGGTVMPLYDELYHYTNQLNHILVRHEQGAVHAAEGYARSTGQTGVCLATAGPGATNFVTGIADAMMDSTPIICITAQVSADKLGSHFFQEADMIGITLPITKWSYQITHAAEIPEVIEKAFYIAHSGRPGPVLISIARNAQVEKQMFDKESFQRNKQHTLQNSEDFPKQASSLSPQLRTNISLAATLLNASQKPLILAGQGVILSGAENMLKTLAEKGNIPVATTLLGISCIPSDHPLYFGNVGMHGHIAPNKMTQQADVILAIGMRFSDRVTGEVSGYAPNAKIIHIEIDKAEINKNIKVHLAIHADVSKALEKLTPQITDSPRTEWLEFARKEKKHEYDSIMLAQLENSDGITMGQMVESISRISKNKAVIVTDVGQNQMFSARYGKFMESRSWVTSGGLGTMGFGLPAAIGAKMGNPDKEVIAIVGDGGLQMNIQELGTIMQSNIAVKIVLLNNSFLGMVRQWQELFFHKRYSFTPLANPDFMQLSAAYSIRAERITSPQEIDAAVEKMYNCDGPYFLEAVVKKEENVFPMIPAGATLNEILVTKQFLNK